MYVLQLIAMLLRNRVVVLLGVVLLVENSRRASRPGRKKSKSFLRHIPASGNYFGLSRGCVETEPDGAAKVPDTETGESVRFRCPVCGSDARGLATGFRSVTNSMMFVVGDPLLLVIFRRNDEDR